jgi:hypothetical protein
VLVNGRWCHTVGVTVPTNFWNEIEQPILEYDVPRRWVDAKARGVMCKVDQDLISGEIWDGEQHLKFEWGWRRCSRYCFVYTQMISEEVRIWSFKVKLARG